MSLICFTSQKGSPGTTLSALAVAAAWPTSEGKRKLFVEADPSGGVLALRYGLGLDPGLVTLAVAIRSGIDGDLVWKHAQELPGGLPVILGPDNPDRATTAFSAAGSVLGGWLSELDNVDVFVDIGRLSNDSPATALIRCADLTLMVARPCVEQLQPAAQRMQGLPVDASRIGWLLIGEHPYSAVEVSDAFNHDVVGVIADDRRGAIALEQGASGNRLRRSALARSAAVVATELANRLHVTLPASTPSEAAETSAPLAAMNGASHDR